MAAKTRRAARGCAALARALYEHWRAGSAAAEQGYGDAEGRRGRGGLQRARRAAAHQARASTCSWFHPTGWADVGYAPAQVATKEVCAMRRGPAHHTAAADRRVRPPAGADLPRAHPPGAWSFYCRLTTAASLEAHPLEVLDGLLRARPGCLPLVRDGEPWIEHRSLRTTAN